MQEINYNQVLESNKDKIFRICRIYSVFPMEPQDLFQEVAYQIWKSLPSFKGNSSVDTWVYRISLNVCLRAQLNLEKNTKNIIRLDAIQFKASTPDTQEDHDEKYELLRQCISTLNESDTSIIILYLEDLAYRQIAEITGLTENHIAVKMKRIRKKLLDCINAKSN